MNTQEIKKALLNGAQFGNEAADWYTLNRCHVDGGKIIVINGRYCFYKTLDSFAVRIGQLIKKGC